MFIFQTVCLTSNIDTQEKTLFGLQPTSFGNKRPLDWLGCTRSQEQDRAANVGLNSDTAAFSGSLAVGTWCQSRQTHCLNFSHFSCYSLAFTTSINVQGLTGLLGKLISFVCTSIFEFAPFCDYRFLTCWYIVSEVNLRSICLVVFQHDITTLTAPVKD